MRSILWNNSVDVLGNGFALFELCVSGKLLLVTDFLFDLFNKGIFYSMKILIARSFSFN